MISVPKVSVCVVTYNQEKYIKECLESIVTQECNFDFEVIVGDDCSTDNTRAIVQEYVDKYPNIVKPLFHEKNIGPSDNFFSVHNMAQGEYICHMDGDDYALPGKLQAQADFMDKNPDCNICFHRMNYIENDKYIESKPFKSKIINFKFYRKDIIEYIAIAANSSKMYRKNLNHDKLPNFELVDYTANVIQVKDGYASYCCNIPLGVYRRGIGIAGSDKVFISVYNTLKYFIQEYPEYRNSINISTVVWFLSALKYKKDIKWDFLKLFIKTFSIISIPKYIISRRFRKELSGL